MKQKRLLINARNLREFVRLFLVSSIQRLCITNYRAKTALVQIVKGLAYCDRLFTLENDLADSFSEERLHKRQTELAPLMDEFFDWCRNQAVLAGSKLSTALEFSLKYETTFRFPNRSLGR